MRYLVEIDYVNAGAPRAGEAARSFVESVIFPTLDRAERLVAEGRIVAGGPVAGRIALRFIAEAASNEELDRLVTDLPLWPVSETRVTPLIEFGERRTHVRALLERQARP